VDNGAAIVNAVVMGITEAGRFESSLQYALKQEHISKEAFAFGMQRINEAAKFNLTVLTASEQSPEVQDEEQPFEVISLENVESQETKWLWKPFFPQGKLTAIEADPGTGKTYFCLSLAAIVSRGGKFYGEPEGTMHEPGNVIYQTAEDGIADTIKPRLESIEPKADFSRIFVINEEKQGLTLSDSRIERTLEIYRPKLFIIDPLQAYIGAHVDMFRPNEVRPIMANIGRLAEKYECTFLFIMHMNKNSQGGQAMYRALGTIDLPAVFRSMLYMGRNPQNKEQRILCHIKSSLAAPGKSLAFEIDPQHGGILFDGESDLDYETITAPQHTRNKPAVFLTDAMDKLGEEMQDGYITVRNAEDFAKQYDISQRTLYNAKKELGLISVSIGQPPKRSTFWVSPEIDVKQFKEAHKNTYEADTSPFAS
jgi:RecA-family ATPase